MSRNLMEQLTEGIDVLGQLRKYQEELEEIEQILCKALGYTFVDNTALGLAKEASNLIAKLKKRHPTQEEALAQYHWLKENSKRNK